MGIKIATEADLEVLMKLARHFVKASPYTDLCDDDTIRTVITNLVNMDKHEAVILMYDEVAFLAGIKTKFMFGTSSIASEICWWVEPDHRHQNIGMKLLKEFELWAKLAGCASVYMVSLDEEVGKFYEKNGYVLQERNYMKV